MAIVCLCGFAFLAGFIDSVVGGGGLIQLPALFVLLPPALTQQVPLLLGTNKMSSVCGTAMAVVQYARHVRMPWGAVLPSSVVAFGCSFLGAWAVSRVPSQFLRPLILVLLVVVGGYTFWRKDLGQHHAPRFRGAQEAAAGAVMGAVIGFYDGFFGPGTGSFLIFILVGLFGFDFLAASAGAKVVNLATNVAALTYFAGADLILYRYALPMGVCNIAGSLLGSRLAILKGSRFVRGFFLVVLAAMILRFGLQVLRSEP